MGNSSICRRCCSRIAIARSINVEGVRRRPESKGRYVCRGTPSFAANARCEHPVASLISRIVSTRDTLPYVGKYVKPCEQGAIFAFRSAVRRPRHLAPCPQGERTTRYNLARKARQAGLEPATPGLEAQ
jgi:hypothetical protein